MKNLPNRKTFFSAVPKYILGDVQRYLIWLQDNGPAETIVKEDIGEHWDEFALFWAQSGETPDWFNFVSRSHNLDWFVTYAFARYPDSRERALKRISTE